jgi:putative ABC transport system permease protein
MLRNYITTALRNFRRNRTTSLINLLGLALGLATCLVAALYIRHELSADKFHRDLTSIYRITVKLKQYDMNGTPYPLTETLEKDLPSVKASLRTWEEETTVRIQQEKFKHAVLFSDPNFFSFFTFTLQQGNARQALNGLKQVVISDAMRQKYFPDKSPLGETIQIKVNNEYVDFQITGVADPAPAYSSMVFDFIIPLENRYISESKSKNDWSSFFITSFIKVDADNLKAFKKTLPDFVTKYIRDAKNQDGTPSKSFVLNPFAEHHLHGGYSGGGLKGGRSVDGLYVFAGIALLILLLACFNFMNLTNAQSSKRVIEVGVRKVVGAARSQLIRQFLAEALVLSAFAAVLALGLAELSLIMFSDILEANISIFDKDQAMLYAGLLGMTTLAGLLAGSYPAIVLSRLTTLNTFKRYFKIGGNNWLTRSVLFFQFGLSIILIVSALVMWKQQQYLTHKDLGYNQEQVLVVPVSNSDTASINLLKNEIRKYSETVRVAKSSGAFTRSNNVSIQKMADDSRMFIYMINIDEDFVPTMEMKIIKGEGFREDAPGTNTTILANEALVKKLGLEDSIGIKLGRRIGWIEHPTIIGVVKDFHHAALRSEIEPMMFLHNNPLNDSYLMIRLAPQQIANGLAKIKSLWETTNPNSPFEYFFLDDDVNKQYASEQRWSKIISMATGMAIFLSVLGLIGLAMYTAEQRKKEIGIRKVLGASLRQLIALLSKDYLWLIVVAFMFAVPISYYVMMHYWLDNFAYKISMGTDIYLLALVVVLVIAVFAVGSQTVKAAMQNPADTLKEE